MSHVSDWSAGLRLGYAGAALTIAGVLLSGPLALLLVIVVRPQPSWAGPGAFVANYHVIQTLPFYFGFLLLGGSILMMAAIYALADDKVLPLAGVIFTSIAAGLIAANYIAQTTFIPALVADYTPQADPLITAVAMANPTAFTWALEMWGYAILGVGTWFAASFFGDAPVERAARTLFVANGVLSVIGGFVTGFDLSWPLSRAGLVAFGFWNLLYLIMAALFLATLHRRARVRARTTAMPPPTPAHDE